MSVLARTGSGGAGFSELLGSTGRSSVEMVAEFSSVSEGACLAGCLWSSGTMTNDCCLSSKAS